MLKDKVIKTINLGSSGFFCENCLCSRNSTNTTIRIYKSGIETQIDHCAECKVTQETEYIKGPTLRVENKDEQK